MSHGDFTRAAARPSASAAGRWRSHDAPPSPTRDAAGCTLKQHLWGARYVDDLVQIAVNDDPTDANEADCESFYYPMQNANFNVIGLSDANGTLVERYEYTPYGQRTVYKKAGSDDELTTAPLYHSQRVETDAGRAPYGLCDVGHQGLMHDEQFGLVYNRNRYLDPRTGRWTQHDPAGYVAGTGLYLSRSGASGMVDPSGLRPVSVWAAFLYRRYEQSWEALYHREYRGSGLWSYYNLSNWVYCDHLVELYGALVALGGETVEEHGLHKFKPTNRTFVLLNMGTNSDEDDNAFIGLHEEIPLAKQFDGRRAPGGGRCYEVRWRRLYLGKHDTGRHRDVEIEFEMSGLVVEYELTSGEISLGVRAGPFEVTMRQSGPNVTPDVHRVDTYIDLYISANGKTKVDFGPKPDEPVNTFSSAFRQPARYRGATHTFYNINRATHGWTERITSSGDHVSDEIGTYRPIQEFPERR